MLLGVTNKGCEIALRGYDTNGDSGFQMCNLSTINGAAVVDADDFYECCAAASILGTLQAGYTDFKYLSKASRNITEKEALIGVSVTGWMNNPVLLFNEQVMRQGAITVKEVNKQVAKLIGINQAARTTCAKPEGNSSVILMTASGIHGEHSPMYIRNVQMNEQDEVLGIIASGNPEMVEKSVWSSNGTDSVVSFPIVTKPGSIYKKDLLGVKQLEYVKKAQQVWVEFGTNIDLCVDPTLRHNISNTITVDDWDAVEKYLYDNRQWFAGVSLLSSDGDRAYAQAPFTEVFTAKQILETYGEGSMLASGLIVDALHAFNNNLWMACDTVLGQGMALSNDSKDLLKRDWVRRANKYADNFFSSDVRQAMFCLKDCHNLHKWVSINRNLKPIDFSKILSKQKTTDVDTLAGAACAGGLCEVVF